MKNKNASVGLSILAPAYFYNVFLGFVPAVIKPKNYNNGDHYGPFHYSPSLTLPQLLLQLTTLYLFYDSTIIAFTIQRGLIWVALLLLYMEIFFLFINWALYKKDYIRIFNEAHRLLRNTRGNSVSLVDILPLLTTYGYFFKPIVLPQNFVHLPTLNLLLYVRLATQLSLETIAYAALRSAEVVLRDLDRSLTHDPGVDLLQVITMRMKVHEFVKNVSHTIGTLYFPVVLITLCIVIAGNLFALKPVLNKGLNKVSIMYLIEWSGPLSTIFIVCRRSQAVFEQSRKMKRALQEYVFKRKPNGASIKLVPKICKLVDDDDLYLKAEVSLAYDSSLWLMIMNLILTNILALVPATNSF